VHGPWQNCPNEVEPDAGKSYRHPSRKELADLVGERAWEREGTKAGWGILPEGGGTAGGSSDEERHIPQKTLLTDGYKKGN